MKFPYAKEVFADLEDFNNFFSHLYITSHVKNYWEGGKIHTTINEGEENCCYEVQFGGTRSLF